MELYKIRQDTHGGIHTYAQPASWADITKYGIDASPEDVRLNVIWVGSTSIWKSGIKNLIVILPINYPRECGMLWLEGLRHLTSTRMKDNYRACISPRWTISMSIAGFLSESLQTYVANLEGGKVVWCHD